MDKILLLIPSLITASTNIIDYINSVRQAAQQTGEWSVALEEEFQAMLNTAKTDPAWQSDPPAPAV